MSVGDGGSESVEVDGWDRSGGLSIRCTECSAESGPRWRGWGAYRTDDPELGEPPTVSFYCPSCAESEFGRRRRGR